MRIHHVIRGGLIFVGTGIGAMSLTASAGVGNPGMTDALAAGHVAVGAVERAEAQAAPLPLAPAAVPVVVAAPVEDEVAPLSDPDPEVEPERPVVQAGPGPATPVAGATTLIDPLVIERPNA